MSARAPELNFLRYLNRDSVVHRMSAATKVVCLVLLGIAVGVRPSWASVGIGFGVVLSGFVAARLPLGVLPHLPAWIWIGIAITGFFALLAGGDPSVTFGGITIGFDGLLVWLRLTLITVLTLLAAGLLGWTTQLGELAPALARLLRPLKVIRVPVDEFVLVVSIAARCFPLVLDEFRTLAAAWRVRSPEVPQTTRGRIARVHDVLVTALVSAVRRARDMGAALEARGADAKPDTPHGRPAFRDLVALVVTAGAAAAMIVL